MSTTVRPLATVSVCVALAAAPMTAHAVDDGVPGTVGATPVSGVVEAPRPAFYEPPSWLPRRAGTVIRTEALDAGTSPFGLSEAEHVQKRVMYSTKDRAGRTFAATGLVVAARSGWDGPAGRRPVVVHAPGTRGSADRCAASRLVQPLSPVDIEFVKQAVARGAVVVIPDYQGLGTPGTHTYMVREAQAHAVLDLARAARTMKLGVGRSNPVGLNGYSQGGGAVAAAAELAPRYAPDLTIKGVAVGAPPADLKVVGANIDGTPYSGLGMYTAAALFSAYDIDPTEILNTRGVDALRKAESACNPDLGPLAMTPSSAWTTSGQSFPVLFEQEPLKSAIEDNRIGRIRPKAPILITHSRGDDLVPFAVGRQLAQDWCSRRARVTFRPSAEGNHNVGAVAHTRVAGPWLLERFEGGPVPRGCTGL